MGPVVVVVVVVAAAQLPQNHRDSHRLMPRCTAKFETLKSNDFIMRKLTPAQAISSVQLKSKSKQTILSRYHFSRAKRKGFFFSHSFPSHTYRILDFVVEFVPPKPILQKYPFLCSQQVYRPLPPSPAPSFFFVFRYSFLSRLTRLPEAGAGRETTCEMMLLFVPIFATAKQRSTRYLKQKPGVCCFGLGLFILFVFVLEPFPKH
jgi:hypothetical protein